jgi:Contractile injection system tube protein
MGLDIAGGVAAAAGAFGGDLLGLTKPTKAKLSCKATATASPNPSDDITCMFNPTEYSLSRTVTVQRNNTPVAAGGTAHYAGSGPLSLSMQLFFDDFASMHGDVTKSITKLMTWTVPTDPWAHDARPPLVGFNWGNTQLQGFWGYITTFKVNYTVFRMDGTPVQAKVDLTIQEYQPPDPQPTNPTSHAINSKRIRTLTEGETLQALAYRELGKATYWRAIAELNDVDDPMAVHSGMTLIMPTKADAAKVP